MTDHNDTGATARPWREALRREPERYAACSPEAISHGSQAQMKYFVADAQHDIAILAARLAEVERERDDIRSTLNAWFNTSNKLEPDISKLLLDGLNGYIRRSESGGMPFELADDLRAVIEDFCRLYVGELLTPYIEQAKSSAEARVAVLEKALEFYANSEIYKPHPHGAAFDRRDKSYIARTALAADQKEAGK